MTSREALWKIFETAFRQGNVVVDLRKQYEQVLNDLEDFEWLKSKLNLTFLNTLSDPEDKERVLEIMGIKIDY